jgi:6-phosphogluconate dehydrogenase
VEIGFYGLGRMGGNMTLRLLRAGHRVVASNRSPDPVREAEAAGAIAAFSLDELVQKTQPPRALWVMVPAGDPTERALDAIAARAAKGDVLVDGGNSYFRDSMRRASKYGAMGLRFVDAGVSGGIWGLRNGYCMMLGGDADAIDRLRPALDTLAPPNGWAHFGKAGAGHFVKMVHNGIEYGMMQAYGEGFELLHASEFGLDLQKVAAVWNHGSVVRSWLLELAERAFETEGADLAGIKGYVEDSGEGRWTIAEAITHSVPATALAHSLFARFTSRQDDSYAMKVAAALRNQFGGHAVERAAAEASPPGGDNVFETDRRQGAGADDKRS